MSPLRSPRLVYVSIAVALLLFAAGAVGSFQVPQTLISDNQWVAHTYQVLAELNAVTSNLSAAESSQRGYILTGQSPYFDDFYQASAGLKAALVDVRALTSDNSTQQKRLDALEPLVDQRLNEFKGAMDTRTASGFAEALQAMTAGNNAATAVAIQGLVTAMVDEENRLLAIRTTSSDLQTRNTEILLVGAYLLSFVLMAGTVALLVRETRKRRKTEESLAAESRSLRILMDAIPDTIYFKDLQSRFTRINRAQAAVLGVEHPNAALGKQDADFFPAVLSDEFIDKEQTILKSGKSIIDRVEYNPLPDGQPRWFAATKVPFVDDAGNITGLVGISRNVTQRRQAEADLQHTNEELMRSVAAVERHNREITLFNELLDILQTCEPTGEAYAALAHAVPQLLPSTFGALFMINASQITAEAVQTWGSEELSVEERVFGRINAGRCVAAAPIG